MSVEARYVWWKHGKGPHWWEAGYKPKEWEKVLFTPHHQGTIYHPKFNNTPGNASNGSVPDPRFEPGHTYWTCWGDDFREIDFIPPKPKKPFKPFKALLKKQNSPFNGMQVDVVSECVVKGEPGYMIKVDGSTHGPYFQHRFTPIDLKPLKGRTCIVRVAGADRGYPC